MNPYLRVGAIILSPISTQFERIFSRPKIGSLEGHFGFLAQNAGNHVQNIANIVWIAIYACSRSFWAQSRLDLRDFFDGRKLAPWRAILGFWPKTFEIMYKTFLILWESWSTRFRDHFEPNLAFIWEAFWRPKIGSFESQFGFLGKNAGNHVQIMANIAWIVMYALPRSFWAQTRRELREFFDGLKLDPCRAIFGFWPKTPAIMYKSWQFVVRIVFYALPPSFWDQTWRDLREFFDGPKFAPWRAILGFWPKTLEIRYKTLLILYESWSTRVSRSFWAEIRVYLRDLFHGRKLSPSAMLDFWPETLEIMYKTLLILYESWWTRSRDHFEPKLATIWDSVLTAQNGLLGGPFWVFGPKRWKSCTKHC